MKKDGAQRLILKIDRTQMAFLKLPRDIIYKTYSLSLVRKKGPGENVRLRRRNPSRLAIKSNSNFIHYKLPTYKTSFFESGAEEREETPI